MPEKGWHSRGQFYYPLWGFFYFKNVFQECQMLLLEVWMETSPIKENAIVNICKICFQPYKRIICQICNRETCYSCSLRRKDGFSDEKIVCPYCLHFEVYLHNLRGEALHEIWQNRLARFSLNGCWISRSQYERRPEWKNLKEPLRNISVLRVVVFYLQRLST